jgi:hypothetical protein
VFGFQPSIGQTYDFNAGLRANRFSTGLKKHGACWFGRTVEACADDFLYVQRRQLPTYCPNPAGKLGDLWDTRRPAYGADVPAKPIDSSSRSALSRLSQ